MTGVLTWLSQETLLDRALVPPTEKDHLRSEFWRAGYSSEPYKTAEQKKMFFLEQTRVNPRIGVHIGATW